MNQLETEDGKQWMVEHSEVDLKVEEGSLAVINLIGDRTEFECLMNVKTL